MHGTILVLTTLGSIIVCINCNVEKADEGGGRRTAAFETIAIINSLTTNH